MNPFSQTHLQSWQDQVSLILFLRDMLVLHRQIELGDFVAHFQFHICPAHVSPTQYTIVFPFSYLQQHVSLSQSRLSDLPISIYCSQQQNESERGVLVVPTNSNCNKSTNLFLSRHIIHFVYICIICVFFRRVQYAISRISLTCICVLRRAI